jgi:thiamine-phosphate pyrophosphorylase
MRSDIFRILDVNLNRATEGLRVVEEVCRFVLEDERLTLAVKKLRSELFKIIRLSEYQRGEYPSIRISEKLIGARKVLGDVGRELYPKSEGRRINIESVFRANMKRTQEAVRCLEEFSKMIKPKFGRAFKAVRFQLYDLEKKIAPRVSKAVKLDFDLYLITDPQFGHLKMLRQAIASGIKIVQFRDKIMSKKEYLCWAKKLAASAMKAGVTFMLNDYWDLVKVVGADGVHLGQEDLASISLRKVRKELGEEKIIGVSIHSLAQALHAEKLGADYIAVGPVFPTPSKPQVKPVGLGLLKKVIKRIKIPVVAIGGINPSNLDQIKRVGCQRVAAIRGIFELVRRRKELE